MSHIHRHALANASFQAQPECDAACQRYAYRHYSSTAQIHPASLTTANEASLLQPDLSTSKNWTHGKYVQVNLPPGMGNETII